MSVLDPDPGHDWRGSVERALGRFSTPFFLTAWRPVETALASLAVLATGPRLRHWLSFKTHPVRRLVQTWRERGGGVETVSEYELRAVLAEGFAVDNILVNGVAKHRWLPDVRQPGLRVHFDSLGETLALVEQARRDRWRVGLRIDVREGLPPDHWAIHRQFGMVAEEAREARIALERAGIEVEGLHTHLFSNIPSADFHRRALAELRRVAGHAGVRPRYLDLGGGLPASGDRPLDGSPPPADSFSLGELAEVLRGVPELFPEAGEVWFENGAWVTGRAGVLVITVLDVKERSDARYLICDGGRTNHAFISQWRLHEHLVLPERTGELRMTAVCGMTCTAFDVLMRTPLPGDVRAGDRLVWCNAGAYHIPWETRFSNGSAAVVWEDGAGELSLARPAESFEQWWGQWA
jgi:diaminopimelate decarboxylase